MKQRLTVWVLVALVVFSTATNAMARPQEADREVVDARLEGYGGSRNVTLEGGSTALLWLLFAFLGAVCVVGLFKDAKRTHLD
jgi:hypothetical protein